MYISPVTQEYNTLRSRMDLPSIPTPRGIFCHSNQLNQNQFVFLKAFILIENALFGDYFSDGGV